MIGFGHSFSFCGFLRITQRFNRSSRESNPASLMVIGPNHESFVMECNMFFGTIQSFQPLFSRHSARYSHSPSFNQWNFAFSANPYSAGD